MAEQYELVRIKKSVKDLLAKNKLKTGIPMSVFIETLVTEKLSKTK